MPSLFTNQQLPQSSEEAIREFDERYLAIVTAAEASGWADRFVTPVEAPRVTFPMSAFAAKFRETKEYSSRFKTMREKSFDLKVIEFDEGFEAPLLDLRTNAFSYRNWQRAPERLMMAKRRHVAAQLAELLESGTSASVKSPWDGVQFFHATDHKSNPFDKNTTTFGNYQSSAKDPASVANIQAEMTQMMLVPDANGDKLGAYPTEIWLPTQKVQAVSDLLNQERLANGESNPIKGKLKVVHVPELTDANDWYLVDGNLIAAGFDPCILADYMPAEDLGMRYWDETSDFFKDTGKIKASQHIWTGSGLVFPHAIRRVAGA